MTFLIIIAIIVGGMILFSVINKDDRGQINSSINSNDLHRQSRKATSEVIKDFMTEAINEEGMAGLVSMIQMTYTMHNVKAEVSHNGNELITNMLDDALVSQYYDVMHVLQNKHLYTTSEISMAGNFIQMLKASDTQILQSQSREDRALFRKAGVKKYTCQIDGNHISTIEYTN